MNAAASPFLPFHADENREYGSIRMFDADAEPLSNLPFRYSRFVVAPRLASRRDQHKVLETWVILSGSGTLVVDDRSFEVNACDVVHFQSMQTHQIMNHGTIGIEIFSFWWERE